MAYSECIRYISVKNDKMWLCTVVLIIFFNPIFAELMVPLHFGWWGKSALPPNSWNICPNDLKLFMKLYLPTHFSKMSNGVCHCLNVADGRTFLRHQTISQNLRSLNFQLYFHKIIAFGCKWWLNECFPTVRR